MLNQTCAFFLAKSQDKKILFAFMLFIFLFYMQDGSVFSPDSSTYINHSLIRVGLYPLTISLFQCLFKGYALQALVGFQLIFTILASYFLATLLQTTFKLPSLLHWTLMIVFLSPLIFFQSANDILSEGLAYPLFLLTSYFFLKGILQKNIKDLCIFSFTTFLLVFTRQQYLFFYGVALFSFLFLFFFARDFQKKGAYFLSIVLSLGAFFVAERACHLVFHGSFSQTPFIGSQLVIRPLFLASDEAYKVFTDPKQQQLVKETMEQIISEKLVDKDLGNRYVELYTLAFNSIMTVFTELRGKIWPEKLLKDQYNQNSSHFNYIEMIDQKTTDIAITLIKNNFVNYVKLYIKDVIRGLGGYAFFVLVFFINFLCFWNIIFNNKINTFYISFILATLIHFGNLIIICVFEPPLMRYTYSTSVLLLSMLLIMGYQYTSKQLVTMGEAV